MTITRTKEEVEQLATDYYKLAYFVANRWVKKGVIDINEGNSCAHIALMRCIRSESFDPDKSKFTTYLFQAVNNEVGMFLRKANKYNKDISLDAPVGFDKDGNELVLGELLSDDTFQQQQEHNELIDEAISIYNEAKPLLSVPQREAFELHLKGMLQRDIAKRMNISQSYVSRLMTKAIHKMLKVAKRRTLVDERRLTPKQIVAKENKERTFVMDESMKFVDKKRIATDFIELISMKDPVEAQKAMVQWATDYSDNELAKIFKTKFSWIRRVRVALNIEKDRSGQVTIHPVKEGEWPLTNAFRRIVIKYVEEEGHKYSDKSIKYSNIPPEPKVDVPKEREPEILMGLNLSVRGIYTTEALAKRLEGIIFMLTTGSEGKVFVDMSIKEV